MKHLLILTAIYWTLLGCQTAPTPNTNTEVLTQAPNIIYKAVWDSKPKAKEWTDSVVSALEAHGSDMLKVKPKDESKWCPGLGAMSEAKKKQFYVYLISAMAERESNFKPELTYTESFNDSKGKKVISRGMLQISIESGNAYGCGFKTTADLHDAGKNLSCGVKILHRWIGRDQHIGPKQLGGARYWSVLRDTSGSQGKIKSKTLEFCKGL